MFWGMKKLRRWGFWRGSSENGGWKVNNIVLYSVTNVTSLVAVMRKSGDDIVFNIGKIS